MSAGNPSAADPVYAGVLEGGRCVHLIDASRSTVCGNPGRLMVADTIENTAGDVPASKWCTPCVGAIADLIDTPEVRA